VDAGPEADVRVGLTRRTIAVSAVLALVIGAVFAVLVSAIGEQRDSASLATRSEEVIARAFALERLVLDFETGQRGFLVTREERFLQPWRDARSSYRASSDELVTAALRVDVGVPEAQRIASVIDAYVRNYSVPLVAAARKGEASARSSAALAEGKRRVDEIRGLFGRFVVAERRVFTDREQTAQSDARQAIVIATGGLAGSIALIVLFGTYLTRAIALPVRRAAGMAGRLAGGDLTTRMPETGVGEVRELERAFNTMGRALQSTLEEQASLRRVATLVARGVPAAELFGAVAAEVRRLLDCDATRLLRYEADGTVTIVGGRDARGVDVPTGDRFAPEEGTVSAEVLRTGQRARADSYQLEPGPMADAIRAAGVRCSIGAPIAVEGRLWGAMIAAWRHDADLSPETEQRVTQFTELIATAIANAKSRDDLAASRARVVATADETRRRIEGDLHDGAQQRLVHAVITLKLARRALAESDGPAAELLDEALGHAESANAELRELAHGILPAALVRGGLNAAVETLVSRVRLPVAVDVTDERLPPALEAAAYFIVAEALTNTVKHARATRAGVTASVEEGALHVEVRDDGVGGADADGRFGLLGLHDRAAAMNGELQVHSPPGGGTVIAARLPIPQEPPAVVQPST
jgi:signal transduction histidine kinase